MELILVRHAKAFERDPLAWPDDSRRPLTEEGARAFRSFAKQVRSLVPEVDVLETSSFERARATAEILHERARWPRPIRAERLEPADDWPGSEDARADLGTERLQALVRAVTAMRALRVVAWVGHEPMLSAIASLLLAGRTAGVRIDFRKGAALAIGFDALTQDPASAVGGGRLLWMTTPRMARRMRGKS